MIIGWGALLLECLVLTMGRAMWGLIYNGIKRLKIIVVGLPLCVKPRTGPATIQLVLLDQPSTFLRLKFDEISIWISEKDERID